MRSVILTDYILDSSGFVIDREGNILPNHVDVEGNVYVTIRNMKHYYSTLIPSYIKPVYKNIKYLKQRKVWGTYVKVTGSTVENRHLLTEQIAAIWVNQLYIRHNLIRIPNVVPIKDYIK